LKSGSIGGVRAFAGYHTALNGKKYVIAIIVNNFDGSASEVRKQMWELLDLLK